MDGELLNIKTGADEAAPFGSAQQLERKQREAPGTFFETGSCDDAICLTTTPLHRECGRTGIWRGFLEAIWRDLLINGSSTGGAVDPPPSLCQRSVSDDVAGPTQRPFGDR